MQPAGTDCLQGALMVKRLWTLTSCGWWVGVSHSTSHVWHRVYTTNANVRWRVFRRTMLFHRQWVLGSNNPSASTFHSHTALSGNLNMRSALRDILPPIACSGQSGHFHFTNPIFRRLSHFRGLLESLLRCRCRRGRLVSAELFLVLLSTQSWLSWSPQQEARF